MYISQLIAADAVHQVFSGRNLTLALPAALSLFPAATPQQKGAAADLSYGTLRFYGEIDTYLKQLLEKPLTDERLHAVLLVAIYQLLHDKADAFTVVNQAVHAVSQLKRPMAKSWAKGLVNAILRNFLRQKDALNAQSQTNEVAIYSYPQWWINKLKTQYSEHWQNILAVGNQHPPMTLRVNTHKISAQDYLQLLARQEIEANHIGAQAVELKKPIGVDKIPGFTDGVASVQDYGAQLAAQLLDVQANMRVLDACCAPGGKTGHILELAEVQMTALDSDETRLQRVQSNLDRLNLKASLLVGDAASTDWYDGKPFDKILADVPCTASGIVRRHVDIKWLRRESDVASFVAQQAKILPNLWQMLAKGGQLLYVTCSVFDEENQRQIDQFLRNHTDASQLPLDAALNNPQANITHINGQLIPSNAHDGFFYALLQKN
ncbi:MAG: 16S rRNA (cytosine(967)-C(5))-methyltransferase RsmB [Methylotenera sp.]|nr:16S rRNA (cytosine(967)-C(5))-methyltransferase RsmB [Methylotenera sp.]MDO9388585.1 16S rRNA (cytosine(967)-C(5))-methyltransferase RsmB [Methylotenera sp.]MDP1597368.1 16S rRNA (cytosine(967)-C(5))-methyltransferase RsmB [Methylotenera sp.]MDP1754466.1 16S rRNA (cytosine(967)-C(5))-methyltransferase RsmB [Methylotenera sp.]MDP1960263.1 16S rRNA (cytosine(967)-C(5))-methyltransferase RsmB [Methylotenera sp.]